MYVRVAAAEELFGEEQAKLLNVPPQAFVVELNNSMRKSCDWALAMLPVITAAAISIVCACVVVKEYQL